MNIYLILLLLGIVAILFGFVFIMRAKDVPFYPKQQSDSSLEEGAINCGWCRKPIKKKHLFLDKYCPDCFNNKDMHNQIIDKEYAGKESGFKILVLDDEPSVAASYFMILALKGINCIKWVDNSDDALSLLEKEPFDLFITDMKHHGISGIELLEKIKGHYPNMQRIVITAYATESIHALAITYGAMEFLRKPFFLEEIYELVERARRRNMARKEQGNA